ncbi:MAG TPA: ATP-binding protein [Bacteroidales bacterium]|nr:ATP-binding protein [Bacteroidales bacterium]
MKFYRKKTEIQKLKDRIGFLEKRNKDLEDKLASIHPNLLRYPSDVFALKTAVDLEYLGIGLYEPEKNLVRLSSIAVKLFGLSDENTEIVFDNYLQLIAAEDKAAVQKSFREAQGNGKLQFIDYKIIMQDQERDIRHVASHIKLLKSTDGKELMLFTVSDISKQEKIKRELLRAKEKAEDLDKLKNIYLSNISREIRMPMNSIVGFAELLNIESITPEEKSEYVKIIKLQSNVLLKLIDDISEVSRLEAGDVKINKSQCNLNLLLNELLGNSNQQKKMLKKENLDLILNIPDKKGIITFTDSGRLQQVLTNLISNAIKFTEKGYIEFGYTEKDNLVEFYVKDTGIGLNKDEQKQIFDRFKYDEETITRKYEGSGLGLTIAKGIVRLLGGKIWIDSEPGKGTTIFFNIPLEEVPMENIEEVIIEEHTPFEFNWKGKLILVVEDDDVNFKFIETILLENQAQVLRANNGLQAVELYQSINKIDLILMDIKMPEMDGFEATRKIRSVNRQIPIIAQTAFALEEDREKCLQAGCDEHVTKPIDIKDLMLKINHCFNR